MQREENDDDRGGPEWIFLLLSKENQYRVQTEERDEDRRGLNEFS